MAKQKSSQRHRPQIQVVLVAISLLLAKSVRQLDRVWPHLGECKIKRRKQTFKMQRAAKMVLMMSQSSRPRKVSSMLHSATRG